MRSEKTSNDFATTADVLMEVIEEYKKLGQEFAYTCCIYPTAPFITAEKLQKAFSIIKEQAVQMYRLNNYVIICLPYRNAS